MRREILALVSLLSFLVGSCGYFVDTRSAPELRLDAGGDRFTKAQLTYDYVRQEVISRRCENCHNVEDASGGIILTGYEAMLANLKSIEQTALVLKTMPKRRPLTEEEASLLRAWIDAGAPEGGADASEPVPSATPQPMPTATPEPLPTVTPKPLPTPLPNATPSPSATPVQRATPEPDATPAPVEGTESFFPYIRDVLFTKHACYECHASGQRAADVPINTIQDLLNPEFPLVIPGDPDKSALVISLETLGRGRMPPIRTGAGMTAEEIKIIRDWITGGAR